MNTYEVRAMGMMAQALDALRQARPYERSERSRRIAICITEMEKVVAYFDCYVARSEEQPVADKDGDPD